MRLPSGHATRAILGAIILAQLDPARADKLMERGREIGWDRVIGGVHHPSDIAAGRVLGQAVAQALLKSPDFLADLKEVKQEYETIKKKDARPLVPALPHSRSTGWTTKSVPIFHWSLLMSPPHATNPGKVYLVGAGPGDPDLITVRGQKTLALADLVLYDYLVNSELLKHTRAEAELVSLGHSHGGRGLTQEEVNRRMIAAAREGKTVVRLKGGDPNLFGRGAEEIGELVAAGIPYEVVPGVTAALAAASHAGISLTNREYASAVALVTGHQHSHAEGTREPLELDYDALARFPGTLVFYMGMTTARHWTRPSCAVECRPTRRWRSCGGRVGPISRTFAVLWAACPT